MSGSTTKVTTASATHPAAASPSATVSAAMQDFATLLCDATGRIRPEGFRPYVQRAENTEMSVMCAAAAADPKLIAAAPLFPNAWFHWLALAYLNLNAPLMAQAALQRLASVVESSGGKTGSSDQVARYLWSAANHSMHGHYDMTFDHVRRANEACETAASEENEEAAKDSDKSTIKVTSQALMQHTLDTFAVRYYCSHRALFHLDKDTPACMEESAASLNISETDLQTRLSRWMTTDGTVTKQCGTVLNAYGRPWDPYDAIGTGTEAPTKVSTEAYVRMAIKTASLGIS